MNVAFKKPMSLTESKKLVKEFKTGTIRRFASDGATLKDTRGRSHTLCFKSNLELKGLVK